MQAMNENVKKDGEQLLDACLVSQMEEELQKLQSNEERIQVKYRLRQFATHLEDVQKMELRLRFVYWACSYVVYNYLRRSKQLDRKVMEFDGHVKEMLREVLSL